MSQKAFETIASARFVHYVIPFAKLFGATTAVFLSRAAYLDKSIGDSQKEYIAAKDPATKKRTGTKYHYYFHSDEQWYEETALSKWELRNAKVDLKANQVIYTEWYGQKPKNYFRVDFKRLAELLDDPSKLITAKPRKRDINYEELKSSGQSPSQVQAGDSLQPGQEAVSDSGQRQSPALIKRKEIIKTENNKDIKENEFSNENSVLPENFQTSENEQKEPEQENVSEAENVSEPEQDLSANEIPNKIHSKQTENSIKNETNKNKKNGKSGSISVKAKKEEEIVTPEQAAIRAEIKRFLAHKCHHAANEVQVARLTGKNKVRLNNAAQTLEQFGALPNHMPALWQHFLNVDTWKGKEARLNPLTNTDPEPIVACWNSFENNGYKAAEQPEKPTYQSRNTQNKANTEPNLGTAFGDSPAEYQGITDFGTIVITENFSKEQYIESRKGYVEMHGEIGLQEILNYENTADYKARYTDL